MIKRVAVNRVYRDKLPFQMGRQFADNQPVRGQLSGDVIAVGLALSRFLDVKNMRMVAGDLHRLITFTCRPFSQPVERIKRRFCANKLRQKNAGSFHRPHTTS